MEIRRFVAETVRIGSLVAVELCCASLAEETYIRSYCAENSFVCCCCCAVDCDCCSVAAAVSVLVVKLSDDTTLLVGCVHSGSLVLEN